MPRRAFTVSELTAACEPPDEETRSLWLRRVRDWSNIGIVPANRQHEGTGRHRLFSPDAVYATAVLLRFADLGIPIGNLRSLARLINAPRRSRCVSVIRSVLRIELPSTKQLMIWIRRAGGTRFIGRLPFPESL